MGLGVKARWSALLAGLVLSVSGAANAAVVITPVEGGPFSLANPIGTVAGFTAHTANTYYFPFAVTDPGDLLSQMQASLRGAGNQTVQFSLWKGTCGVTCTGVQLGLSALDTGPDLERLISAGSYFLKLNNSGPEGSLVSGSLKLFAVPEPGTWALLLTGFGSLGSLLRRRRRLEAARTAA
jgi:hypothetical protein